MPTIVTHAAAPLLVAHGLCPRPIPWRLLLFTAGCAMLPDADVLGFKFGVQYADTLGHRGFSHSLFFALLIGLGGLLLRKPLRARAGFAFLFPFLGVASHILLDAMTTGGLGVMAFWPLDHARHFLPWRPITVSPFSPRQLLGERGLRVFSSELLWVWAPCFVVGLLVRMARPRTRR